MKGLPYFCWYPADVELNDHWREMDFAARGFFMTCLNYAWKNGGIPADVDRRARALQATRAVADRLWKQVEACFIPDPENDKMMVNERQEEERAKAIERHLRGRKGQAARAAQAMLKQSLGTSKNKNQAEARAYDSDSDSSEVSTSNNLNLENWRLDENFIQYRDYYLAAGAVATEADWARCWWEWNKLDFKQKTDAIAYAKRCDPAWVKHPQNVLKDREWTRPERPAPKSKIETLMDSI